MNNPIDRNRGRSLLGLVSLCCIVALWVVSIPALADNAASQSDPDVKQITGEVKKVFEYQDKLLLDLVEWPAVIWLNDETKFSSDEGLAISIDSAKLVLPGKPVTIEKRIGDDGLHVAVKVTILKNEKLNEIKALQEERMGSYKIERKDAFKRGR